MTDDQQGQAPYGSQQHQMMIKIHQNCIHESIIHDHNNKTSNV